MRLDLRLAVPAAAAWLAAAVADGWSPRRGGILGVATVALALLALAGRRRVLAAVGLGLALGAVSAALHVAALGRGPVAAAARHHDEGRLTLTLVRDPVRLVSRHGSAFVLADATATSIDGHRSRSPVVVIAHGSSWLGLLPGQRLVLRARLAPPRTGDSVTAVTLAEGRPTLLGRPPPWQRFAGRVRAALRRACAGLPADERGLVPGLVLGDVSAMPPDLTADFRASGLTHLNAVSGENVAIVLGTVAALARRTGLGRRSRSLVAALALLGFVVLARPSPSVLRAAVMGLVVLAAGLAGRRSQPLPLLAFAVLVLMVADPFLARTPGFALSVLATAAIVVLAPPWTARLSRHLPRPLAAAIAVPAAAQLACTPLIVAVFGQLTPYAVPANLLAAPAVAPTTIAGVSCALVAVGWPSFAAALAWLAALPAGWLAIDARITSGLPGAGLALAPGWGAMLPLTVVGVLGWLVVRARRRRSAHAMLAPWPG